MAAKKDFDIGDLVWAKMKSFPYWPAEIVEPPTNTKPFALKRARHYVYFFGSNNYAWIQDENIVHHSKEMLQSASSKKKSNLLKLAIKQITEEALQTAKSLVEENESPEVLTSVIEKEISQVQGKKEKSESLKVRKKVVPKRRKPLDHHNTTAHTSSGITSRDNFELQAGAIRNLCERNEAIRAKEFTPLNKNIPLIGLGILNHHVTTGHLRESNEAMRPKKFKPSGKNIGFIGLGMMGQQLVKNLLKKHNVIVWNRSIEKSIDVAKFGAKPVLTPADVVEMSDIIFCCVSGSQASKSVLYGKRGILSGLERSPPGSKSYVEMTTMDPTTSREISEAITHKGGRYLEATISGSLKMAEDCQLFIVCSGNYELFKDCTSCFSTFSTSAYLVSTEVGIGSKMNIIHSMLIGISHAALAESMALAKRCNLSQFGFMEALHLGPIDSPLNKEKGRDIIFGLSGNSSIDHHLKAFSLALSLDNNHEQPLLLTAAANQLFKRAKYLKCSDIHDIYNEAMY